MKKIVLLSAVASTMIMAGGDIAPVAAPVAPVAVSGWDFSGQAVVYYQTNDTMPGTVSLLDSLATGRTLDDSLFAQDTSAADAGIQLRAVNKDVFAGIGAGVEASGLATLNLENWMVSDVMQSVGTSGDVDDMTDGGWISQAYLTYGIANTSLKLGRQELPKALSPFAYSEDWNVFKNTFDAVLLVNTDIANTTLVGAWVGANNNNAMGVLNAPLTDLSVPHVVLNNITDFNSLNDDRGVYLLTAQNKSVENLTLTGSWYYGSEFITTDDLNILWGDAQYDATSFNLGIQGGTVMHDAMADDIAAFGAKAGTTFSGINMKIAYSNVNDGGVGAPNDLNTVENQINSGTPAFGMFNIGGTTSALYTSTLADEIFSSAYMTYDSDKFVLSANMDALGGNFSALYAYTDWNGYNGSMDEFDLAYTTNLTESLDLSATYAYMNADVNVGTLVADEDINVVRVVARYNF